MLHHRHVADVGLLHIDGLEALRAVLAGDRGDLRASGCVLYVLSVLLVVTMPSGGVLLAGHLSVAAALGACN